ncbi:MAG: 3-dehydroquinate synthase [Spirochaetaceae bacterium]|jgi:3-dehydroquinate synthase|nr:3-dehydroquinate synthase [Spirochaetaceae bacterium]
MRTLWNFNTGKSAIHIINNIPCIDEICRDARAQKDKALIVCDEHTQKIAENVDKGGKTRVCVLKAGESAKNWDSCAAILEAAQKAALSRDSLFIGVGGGVVSDLTAFCGSIYMRGVKVALVSTTLLGMADAAAGGKTGFDFMGIKNSVGTFYPAQNVYMPLETLQTLPLREWKSGMAEIIKTAVLDKSVYNSAVRARLLSASKGFSAVNSFENGALFDIIKRAVFFKAKIVLRDPCETKGLRVLLNLGHTFAHALETSAGLGTVTHGEAVAWGIVRACELGKKLHITEDQKADCICALIKEAAYESVAPHPCMNDTDFFMKALYSDKKKSAGKLKFVIPNKNGAVLAEVDDITLIRNLINGNI